MTGFYIKRNTRLKWQANIAKKYGNVMGRNLGKDVQNTVQYLTASDQSYIFMNTVKRDTTISDTFPTGSSVNDHTTKLPKKSFLTISCACFQLNKLYSVISKLAVKPLFGEANNSLVYLLKWTTSNSERESTICSKTLPVQH